MNRETQGIVTGLVGGAVLYAALTDTYLRYVKAGLRPLLILTAVLLLATAAVTLWQEYRSHRKENDGHDHGGSRLSWLLVAPVLALVVAAPPALGSYTADRAGTALQRPTGFADLPAGDPLPMRVMDYAARAAFDGGRSLEGRRIELTGFLSYGRAGTPYLTRMTLNCCAADAQPIKVGLAGTVPAGLKADTWLRVTGTYTAHVAKDDINGGPIPSIEVVEVHRVGAPPQQYEN
ncbi:TIGR03943 family putative permease subunit [Virgisporangium ochraceum]|uniref:Membrane protein n=1 Tax=Virgisporangium ochraceum TaxID=65505 RepID=A0A8J4EKI0_9ACTN|nr:TIGR03943 family protein [Virgisporangium ochraceum]GIJ75387.1 membrane protein [Virgisporangium ochraceum]